MNIQSIVRALSFVCLLIGLIGSTAMADPTNRYVSLTGGDIWPYTNWTTAATSINAAVNLANDYNEGDTVLIAAGHYVLTQTVTVVNTRLRGFTGNPDDVLVDGNNTFRCFTLIHSNTLLADLTATNGHPTIGTFYDLDGGGVLIPDTKAFPTALGGGAVVSNCVIVNCKSDRCGGGIMAYTNMTVLRSRIESNSNVWFLRTIYGLIQRTLAVKD